MYPFKFGRSMIIIVFDTRYVSDTVAHRKGRVKTGTARRCEFQDRTDGALGSYFLKNGGEYVALSN